MSELQQAVAELEQIAGDRWYWHLGKGRIKPTEPLWGVGLFEKIHAELRVIAEGETPLQAIANLRAKLAAN